MASSVLLGKRLRRHIRAKVWPVLEEAGFVEFAPLRAYRVGDHAIEVVEFTTVRPEWREPRWLGGEAYGNGATFSLHVGTYYQDVHRLPWSEARSSRPSSQECHRCARLAHADPDSAADGRTFWSGRQGERLEEIVDQAVKALQERGLPYLDHFGDTEAWIEAHDKGQARHPGTEEPEALTPDEAEEAMLRCRLGREARADALDALHRRMHLLDDHLTSPSPCGDVLAALLIGRGRTEEAMRCLDGPKQERLRQMA